MMNNNSNLLNLYYLLPLKRKKRLKIVGNLTRATGIGTIWRIFAILLLNFRFNFLWQRNLVFDVRAFWFFEVSHFETTVFVSKKFSKFHSSTLFSALLIKIAIFRYFTQAGSARLLSFLDQFQNHKWHWQVFRK